VTSRIPQLEHQLVDAARSRAVRRGRFSRLRLPGRRPSAALTFIVGFLLAGGTATAVLVARGEVGGEPTHRYGRDAPEAGMGIHYETRPVVLAADRLRSGERFELVGYQLSSRGQSDLCIDVTFPDRDEAHGCGNDSVRAQSISSGPGHPTQVDGATSAEARRVVVHYEVEGVPGSREAVLVHVDDPEVIRRIRVDGPFGFYVAELPEGAQDIVAEAFDAGGRSMWRAVFSRPDYSRRRSPDFQERPRSQG
jgi:hypothetical protein